MLGKKQITAKREADKGKPRLFLGVLDVLGGYNAIYGNEGKQLLTQVSEFKLAKIGLFSHHSYSSRIVNASN